MDNYELISVDEQKQISLDILSNVAEFCEAHGLKYFIAYGTLIGAVRHKGYIPWDDDIDIYMPRADYNRIIEIYNAEKTQENYMLIDPRARNAHHSYIKVVDQSTVKIEDGFNYKDGTLGVDIDIFPLDGMPDLTEHADWYAKLKKIYTRILWCTLDSSRNLKRKILVPMIKLATGGRNKLLARADKLHKLYPYETSEYVGSFEDCFTNPTDRAKKEYFEDFVMLEFEGRMFRAPKMYHELLTGIYGDYMTPPKNQVTHHSNKAYRK